MTEPSCPAFSFLAFVTEPASLQAARELSAVEHWGETVHRGTIHDAIAYLKEHPSPEHLLVEIATAAEAPDALNALADVCDPGVKVLVASPVNEFSFYSWLVDIGIHAYLLEPFASAALKQALKKKDALASQPVTAKPGTVIAFIGARGGVGTTTLATQIASLLSTMHGQRVALVDLDLHFGTASMAYDLDPSRGVGTLFESPERIDGLFLDRVMVKKSETLSILGAEEPMKEPLVAKAQAADVLLAKLKEKYSFILLDLPRTLTPMTRAALAGADQVVVVAEPTLLSLRDVLRIHDFARDALAKPPPRVVLNRVGQAGRQELKKAEFEKHYGHAVSAMIPALPEISVATAHGEMLGVKGRKSSGLIILKELAALIAGTPAETAASPKRWSKKKA